MHEVLRVRPYSRGDFKDVIHLENQFWNEPVSIQLAKQIECNRDKTTAFFTRERRNEYVE